MTFNDIELQNYIEKRYNKFDISIVIFFSILAFFFTYIMYIQSSYSLMFTTSMTIISVFITIWMLRRKYYLRKSSYILFLAIATISIPFFPYHDVLILINCFIYLTMTSNCDRIQYKMKMEEKYKLNFNRENNNV